MARREHVKALVEKLQAELDLTSGDIDLAVVQLLSDQVDDELKADFLTALHKKGETAEEIVAFVRPLMKRAVDPMIDQAELPGPMIDICGTGGDGLSFFNVSTAAMFVVAAGGAVVAKHGNRRVTSSCGSADVLEQLGVAIDLAPEQLCESLKRHGLGFIFARMYHPAFRTLAGMRERLARQQMRTVFNLLGPLLNPARPSRQLIGVFDPRLTGLFAEVLRQMGRERAWVVHGFGDGGAGMDDISISGATTIAELADGKVTSAVMDVSWLGVSRASVSELQGGDARQNAETIEGILSGKIRDAKRDMTVVNAAGGFVVAGLAKDLKEGIELAREEIDSGRALERLRALQSYSPKISSLT
ncbi:MAG TPA: anthranilate phosphoribosyltransferase [Chthoniobacterales bacterium]|nr:anthranilate phosphoribosyltransferase [Chthoniobacterales bacterium]